ncbi:MAG: shikimate dehydrogenase [Leptospiraceae bacterium]|nr:shikimate dehydrogenase [Leptospiraceae bacterium]
MSHSLSPRLHNAAFANRRINAAYLPFEIEKADAALKRAFQKLRIRGLSVTIPHKGWAARVADELDPLSECSGAANTLLFQDDGVVLGRNTDGPGALRALKESLGVLRGRRFLLLGYGGSATAIAHALALEEKPALFLLSGRNKRKLDRFARDLSDQHATRSLKIRTTDFEDLEPDDVDVIIQTTPLGMQGQSDELPLPETFVQSFHTVFDIVYIPARTPLLKLAAARKARTVPGYLMLLYQAVLQFELFTGQAAPAHLMEQELLAALRSRVPG